jgi:hypothetical protein
MKFDDTKVIEDKSVRDLCQRVCDYYVDKKITCDECMYKVVGSRLEFPSLGYDGCITQLSLSAVYKIEPYYPSMFIAGYMTNTITFELSMGRNSSKDIYFANLPESVKVIVGGEDDH